MASHVTVKICRPFYGRSYDKAASRLCRHTGRQVILDDLDAEYLLSAVQIDHNDWGIRQSNQKRVEHLARAVHGIKDPETGEVHRWKVLVAREYRDGRSAGLPEIPECRWRHDAYVSAALGEDTFALEEVPAPHWSYNHPFPVPTKTNPWLPRTWIRWRELRRMPPWHLDQVRAYPQDQKPLKARIEFEELLFAGEPCLDGHQLLARGAYSGSWMCRVDGWPLRYIPEKYLRWWLYDRRNKGPDQLFGGWRWHSGYQGYVVDEQGPRYGPLAEAVAEYLDRIEHREPELLDPDLEWREFYTTGVWAPVNVTVQTWEWVQRTGEEGETRECLAVVPCQVNEFISLGCSGRDRWSGTGLTRWVVREEREDDDPTPDGWGLGLSGSMQVRDRWTDHRRVGGPDEFTPPTRTYSVQEAYQRSLTAWKACEVLAENLHKRNETQPKAEWLRQGPPLLLTTRILDKEGRLVKTVKTRTRTEEYFRQAEREDALTRLALVNQDMKDNVTGANYGHLAVVGEVRQEWIRAHDLASGQVRPQKNGADRLPGAGVLMRQLLARLEKEQMKTEEELDRIRQGEMVPCRLGKDVLFALRVLVLARLNQAGLNPRVLNRLFRKDPLEASLRIDRFLLRQKRWERIRQGRVTEAVSHCLEVARNQALDWEDWKRLVDGEERSRPEWDQ